MKLRFKALNWEEEDKYKFKTCKVISTFENLFLKILKLVI